MKIFSLFILFYCEIYVALREKKKFYLLLKKIFFVNKSKNKVSLHVLKMKNKYIGSKVLKGLRSHKHIHHVYHLYKIIPNCQK